MTTISNNKLPEWRKALNSAVENYQSTQAWYEENQDSPSAGQDMDAAEGEIEKLIKQYGVLIVLNLLDEIDELQERRKADSAEPVAWTDEEELRDLRKVGFCEMFSVEPISKDADMLRVIAIEYHGTQQLRERIARTVRAAWHHDLEKPNQPVNQTYELPEFIVGMEVSVDVSTCDADAGHRYFGTVTEVSELDTAKNGYILLVQDAKPNFDVNGNSPVTPDGYALVPVEPTDEMIAAAMNCEDVLFNSDESFCVQFGNIYEAMLAAAPKPQNAPQNIPAGKSTLTPDGWISCSERMPAQDDWVLIYSKYGEYLAGQVQGEYVELNDGILSWLGAALHWMPLPAPPQK